MSQNSKKILGIPARDIINTAIYALLLIISTAVMTESTGVLRTLPFVLILPAVATFFINQKLLTVFFCFVITLCFGVVESGDVEKALFSAAASALFAAAGIMAKRFFVTAYVAGDARKLCVVPGVLLMVLGIAAYAHIFGNPVGALSARGENVAYITETYGENSPEIKHTYYSFSDEKYFTNVQFSDEAVMNADISCDGEEIYDGYSNYFEYKLLSARRNEIAKLLSQYFAHSQFALRINIAETELALSQELARQPEKYYGQMVFDLAFYSQITEREEFEKECAGCAEFLKENGVEFKSFNYYGGFADDFLFTMAVPCGFSGDYASLVTDFHGEEFQRYYDESDYAVGWSYGS